MNNQFQSTLPREERPLLPNRSQPISYFNPRSHERSDGLSRSRWSGKRNFNPRSHERSDDTSCSGAKRICNFNPRSHERSDKEFCIYTSSGNISIHAPTRGATTSCDIERLQLYKFQSTLPREERPSSCLS